MSNNIIFKIILELHPLFRIIHMCGIILKVKGHNNLKVNLSCYAWGELNIGTTKNAWDIRRQFIYYNSSFTIDKKYIGNFYKDWYNAGIKIIHVRHYK